MATARKKAPTKRKPKPKRKPAVAVKPARIDPELLKIAELLVFANTFSARRQLLRGDSAAAAKMALIEVQNLRNGMKAVEADLAKLLCARD